MIKAIIKNRISNSNYYKIEIPSMQQVGSSDPFITAATVCYQPGNLYGYMPGDVVFIDFEADNTSSPVILGKLFLGDEQEATSHQNIKDLTVSGRTILTNNTKIGDME